MDKSEQLYQDMLRAKARLDAWIENYPGKSSRPLNSDAKTPT